jgi:RNA polymerase sigma-70 factor, ECF subfamily
LILYEKTRAAEFGFSRGESCELLEEVAAGALGGPASAQERARFLETLRVDDLLLARACARGHEAAWAQFLTLYRGKLYLAAAAIAREESVARELADSLYADLFGMRLDSAGERVSKFNSYLGRGSLEGWLRTVLAQEYINRLRGQRKLVRFEETIAVDAKTSPFPDAQPHNIQLAAATDAVLGAVSAEERFLLASYYLDGRTLAEIGRMLNLHESTVSRHLEKITLNLRKRIIARLRAAGLSKRAAEELLEGDVRDLGVDVRNRLAQERPS